MNVFRHFRAVIEGQLASLVAAGTLPAGLDTERLTVEPPREASRGDLATNAAMVLAKPAGYKPRELAEILAERLRGEESVAAVEVAGPGFINLSLTAAFWRSRLGELLQAGESYGDSDLGAGEPVNVEYVSANPTGPLHVAHARGAVVGDALAGLLAKVGYRVTREYYINDAGAQVATLARSAHLRYREALGEDIGAIPEGYYPGSYLKAVGRALAERDGDKWLGQPEEVWFEPVRAFAVAMMLDDIKADLAALGISFDRFSSERELVESGAVEDALAWLAEQGYLYQGTLEPPKGKKTEDWEPREQTLFNATAFGDDVDRPLRKADGSYTYFANDIAYHRDKFRRGFKEMVDVWGADHGGYVKRLEAAVRAITGEQGRLDVKICAIVNVLQDGKPVRMSKRAGDFTTLGDLIDAVGKDVVRFIMLTRKNTETLDFDLARVQEQSRENPVFYVQYAHARCCSVLRHAHELFPDMATDAAALAQADLSRLEDADDLALIQKLASFPRIVEQAGQRHEPHRLAFYLYDTAAAFHALWNKGRDATHLRFLQESDRELTAARLALLVGVQTVIATGLGVIGVTPVQELR